MNTTSILTWPALLTALCKTPERLQELVSEAALETGAGAGTQQAATSGGELASVSLPLERHDAGTQQAATSGGEMASVSLPVERHDAGTQQAATSGGETDPWSVRQIIGHLCAIESPFRARLARIVLEDNPHVSVIGRISGDYDPDTPVSILLDTFARLRADTVAFLRSLPVDARARPAVHAELGPVTLRSQVAALLAHDEEHLAQIAGLVGRRRSSTFGKS